MKDESILRMFLASSIVEFANERKKIYLSLNRISDYLYINTDYEFDIDRCEEIDSNILKNKERTQDLISKMILDSDICVFLFGNKIGDVTIEELELVLDVFKKDKSTTPIIYFFSDISNEANKLMSKLDKDNIPYIKLYEYDGLDKYKIVVLSIMLLIESIFDIKLPLMIYNNKLYLKDVIIDESFCFDNQMYIDLNDYKEFRSTKDLYYKLINR